MSADAITSITSAAVQGIQSAQTNPYRQRKQDFEALAQALGSGDLAGAQTAFAALQQDLSGILQSGGAQQVAGTSQDVLQNDFGAIGQALAKGDVSGAQSAFAKLLQDAQNVAQGAGHHHHHRAGGAVPATDATGAAAASTGSGINTTA